MVLTLANSGQPSAPPIEPETDQERDSLAAYRDLDDAGQAWLRWAALAELGRCSSPDEDDAE